jgi:hypothetical protein
MLFIDDDVDERPHNEDWTQRRPTAIPLVTPNVPPHQTILP